MILIICIICLVVSIFCTVTSLMIYSLIQEQTLNRNKISKAVFEIAYSIDEIKEAYLSSIEKDDEEPLGPSAYKEHSFNQNSLS